MTDSPVNAAQHEYVHLVKAGGQLVAACGLPVETPDHYGVPPTDVIPNRLWTGPLGLPWVTCPNCLAASESARD